MSTRHDPTAPAPGSVAGPESPDGFHIRAATFRPVRAAYARDVLVDRLGLDPAETRVLVVGSGRGLLARDLAQLGFDVTGLDPSAAAVRAAGDASARDNLFVAYDVGDPHRLPYPDGAFDVAVYADTFEVTDDLGRVLAEAARVLRDGGALLYDTVNRTPVSRLIYLGALQSWRWTRVMPDGRYARDRLRPPDELAAALAEHGLRSRDVRGFLPASPLRLVRASLRARRGDIDDDELARLAGMHLAAPGKGGPVTYLGFAVKQE